MTFFAGRLASLTAEDVMTDRVIRVRSSETLATAAETLRNHHISGAPVIDDIGRLVGILSLWDLVRTDGTRMKSPPPGTVPPSSAPLAPGEGPSVWELFSDSTNFASGRGQMRVGEVMSAHVTSVPKSASLLDIARIMCDGHWHRVPVVDKVGNLVGIISTMDVLAALVNAAEEPS